VQHSILDQDENRRLLVQLPMAPAGRTGPA
jgi:hypothetical protein